MRRPGVLLNLAVILSSAAASAPTVPTRGFTLEQVLSAPFPTDLTAAPSGGAVAWVFNDRGVRNIWVAESPDYKGRS